MTLDRGAKGVCAVCSWAMKVPKSLRGVAKSPWAWGAAALGAWWMTRSTKKPEPDLDLVVFGADMEKRPTVKKGKVGADASGPDVPAKPIDTSTGGYSKVESWRLLSTWEDLDEVERWVTDVHPGDKVRVDIVASVPVVGDWIKIGNKTYTYDEGPGGAGKVIRKILNVSSGLLVGAVGVAEAAGKAPSGSSGAASKIADIIKSFVNLIPDAYEKWRLKKYIEWREALPATKNLRSSDMFTAHKDSDVCQWWRYEGTATNEDKDLVLVNTGDPPAYYQPTLGTCLDGVPPHVVLEGPHVIVVIQRPDVPRESRYDVIVSKA